MIRVVFMLAQEKPTKSAQLLTRAMLTPNTFGPIADFFLGLRLQPDFSIRLKVCTLWCVSVAAVIHGHYQGQKPARVVQVQKCLHGWLLLSSAHYSSTHAYFIIYFYNSAQPTPTDSTNSERRMAGAELDSLWQSERRILSKLQAIMDNDDSDVLVNRRSTFSQRLIPPKCTTEHHRNSFPAGDNQSL